MRSFASALVVLSCSGPAAPDVAICRDVIGRVCMAPLCDAVPARLAVDAGSCEATLLARSGCSNEAFAFTSPSRVEVLDCRVPLLRQGASQMTHPSCADVSEVFTDCPQVVRFLGGTP